MLFLVTVNGSRSDDRVIEADRFSPVPASKSANFYNNVDRSGVRDEVLIASVFDINRVERVKWEGNGWFTASGAQISQDVLPANIERSK